MGRATLDQRLLEAHIRKDAGALIGLYTEAADQAELMQNIDAACFYLTHAFVFALQEGTAEADVLNFRLVSYGRDLRQTFGQICSQEDSAR